MQDLWGQSVLGMLEGSWRVQYSWNTVMSAWEVGDELRKGWGGQSQVVGGFAGNCRVWKTNLRWLSFLPGSLWLLYWEQTPGERVEWTLGEQWEGSCNRPRGKRWCMEAGRRVRRLQEQSRWQMVVVEPASVYLFQSCSKHVLLLVFDLDHF